jgi:hypothetical protein
MLKRFGSIVVCLVSLAFVTGCEDLADLDPCGGEEPAGTCVEQAAEPPADLSSQVGPGLSNGGGKSDLYDLSDPPGPKGPGCGPPNGPPC